MIRKLGHIALATRSMNTLLEFFQDALGMELEGLEVVEDQKVRVGVLKAGDASIELLEPTEADSPVGRFLSRRGEGFHHLTLEVDDIDATLQRLKERNVKLIDEYPRTGAGGRRIAFIDPHSTGGVLIELCEIKGIKN